MHTKILAYSIAQNRAFCKYRTGSTRSRSASRVQPDSAPFPHPALWRRFWAASVRLPHLAPAYSPRKALQGQCGCVKTHKRCKRAPTQPRRSVKRVQRGGSAASTFDSLAQSGAAAVRLPHLAPAFSPRKALQGQCDCAKTHKGRAASPVLRTPVTRRDRHKKRTNPK